MAAVYDLPLSGLQGLGLVGTIKATWEENGQEKANLKSFIDKYLSAFALPAKHLVVMDFLTGNSLYVAEYLIGAYLKEKLRDFDTNLIIPLSLTETDKGSFTGSAPSGKSNITAMDLHTEAFKTLVKGLQSSWFKDCGYRDTAKNHAPDIMGGTHVTHFLIGGYERLVRDLLELFKF